MPEQTEESPSLKELTVTKKKYRLIEFVDRLGVFLNAVNNFIINYILKENLQRKLTLYFVCRLNEHFKAEL